MAVLVIAENPKGQFKKSAFEVTHFGHLTAQALGTECIALVIGDATSPEQLGKYGASKVAHVAHNGGFDTLAYNKICLLYTSPSPRDQRGSRMPSSA